MHVHHIWSWVDLNPESLKRHLPLYWSKILHFFASKYVRSCFNTHTNFPFFSRSPITALKACILHLHLSCTATCEGTPPSLYPSFWIRTCLKLLYFPHPKHTFFKSSHMLQLICASSKTSDPLCLICLPAQKNLRLFFLFFAKSVYPCYFINSP